MNEKKIIKFNLYMTCILLVVMIVFFVGTTIAYFTARKNISATLTSGNVELVLSEAAVKSDGTNLVVDPEKPRIFGGDGESVINDYGTVYPGQYLHKDPTITNTGDNVEWIAAKVTLNEGHGDLSRVMGSGVFEGIDIKKLLSGGLIDSDNLYFGTWNSIDNVYYNDEFAMVQIANTVERKYEFYFFILDPVKVGDSIVLFERVEFQKEWTRTEMQEFDNLKINVHAYGVQTTSLQDCFTAMTEAFPTHFELD